MFVVPLIGYIATVTSMVAFFPQVVKLWRSKMTRDISLTTYLLMTTGSLLWFTYGLLRTDFPVIIANGLVGVLSISIVLLKVKYK